MFGKEFILHIGMSKSDLQGRIVCLSREPRMRRGLLKPYLLPTGCPCYLDFLSLDLAYAPWVEATSFSSTGNLGPEQDRSAFPENTLVRLDD